MLSAVVPCYNEQESIAALHRRLGDVLRRHCGEGYEIILVDDGSRDRTWREIAALARSDQHVLGVKLTRNHGHQLALSAGLEVCEGDRILIIDADLQDPPELLGDMMKMMDEGADVVYGRRTERRGETKFKLATASLFYRLLDSMVDIHIPRDTGDFRLMSRRALDMLLSMPEQHRFVRGMVAWIGLRQVPIDYVREERYAGATNYPLRKMIALSIDAITGFSIKPLRFASYIGLIFGLLAFVGLVSTVYSWFVFRTVDGWTSLMTTVLALGTVQLLVLGVIGEYMGRMFMETKRRPLFLIEGIASAKRDGMEKPASGALRAEATGANRYPTTDEGGRMNDEQRTGEAAEFDRYASEYESLHARNTRLSGEEPSFFSEYKIRIIARLLGGTPPDAILDFGAGIGGSIPFFRSYFPGSKLTCLDVSSESLDLARGRHGDDATYRVFDGERIPLADSSVDLAFAACVFHHIPPDRHLGALQEIRRVLKPGGSFFLFEHNPLNPLTVRAVNTCPFDENAILIRSGPMGQRLRQAGFAHLDRRYCLFFPAALAALRPLEARLGWLPLGAQYYLQARP